MHAVTLRRFTAAASLACAVLAALPAPARAEPDTAARTEAAEHVRQAQAFFQRSDFDRALAEYQQAFELSAEPSLVFDIGLCHDRAHRPEAALEAFRRYVALAPSGSVADEARDDIARLTPIVEHRAAERAARESSERDEASRQRAAAERDEAARQSAGAAGHRRNIAAAVLIGGAVLAVAGGVSHALAWRTRDRLTSASDVDAYYDARGTFHVERDVAIAGYAAGALALAAGAILWYTAGGDDSPRLSAALGSHSAALVLAWSR